MARLLQDYERQIATIEIATGVGGIFEVHVDGELVFEKKMLGHYPEPDDVIPYVHDRLSA